MSLNSDIGPDIATSSTVLCCAVANIYDIF
jgi:hypothetical protein